MYLVIMEDVMFPTQRFFFGVSWEEYTKKDDGDFEIIVNEVTYLIPSTKAIESEYVTRTENIHQSDYRYKQRADETKDYFKALKQVGIDMKLNYSPQFRDGINPMKDNGRKD